MAEPSEAELGAHQLALSPFAAIDQKAIRPLGDEHRRQTALGRRHRRSGAEKGEFEHVACQNGVRGGSPHKMRKTAQRYGARPGITPGGLRCTLWFTGAGVTLFVVWIVFSAYSAFNGL